MADDAELPLLSIETRRCSCKKMQLMKSIARGTFCLDNQDEKKENTSSGESEFGGWSQSGTQDLRGEFAEVEVAASAEAALNSAPQAKQRRFGGLSNRLNSKPSRSGRFISIRYRVGGAFAAVLVVVLILGIVSVTRLIAVKGSAQVLANQNIREVQLASNLKQYLLSMQVGLSGYLITGNQTLIQTDFTSGQQSFTGDATALETLLAGNKVLLQDTKTASTNYEKWLNYAVTEIYARQSGQGQLAIQNESAGKGDTSLNNTMTALNHLIKSSDAAAKSQSDELNGMVLSTIIITAILAVIAILVVVALGIPASVSTPRTLSRVIEILKGIATAGGDLRRRIEGVHSHDEVELLVNATNDLLASTAGMIESVIGNAQTLAASAEELTASADETARAVNEIASTAGDFAVATERARGSLRDMTESMDNVQQFGQMMTTKVHEVKTSVQDVVQRTNDGSEIVESVAQAMSEVETASEQTRTQVNALEKSAKEIGRIVTTIRDLADQTNLLSLNAAIEAARAGDAGRGFAVVAQEVRKLADESRTATLEIDSIVRANGKLTADVSKLMTKGMEAINHSRTLSEHTREAFHEIRNSVERVVPSTEDMLQAVQNQLTLTAETSQKIELVTEDVQQVAAGSEQNAASTEESLATVEEIAASAHALSSLADELQQIVSRFQV